jgi:protein-tyrosine kinase
MENIRQAIERAKSGPIAPSPQHARIFPARREPAPTADRLSPLDPAQRENLVDPQHLLARRIIAHDKTDPRSRSFDMLRTQVLRAMDLKGLHILGVTSPTPGCGKTVTALNLALSISRQPDRSVLLADMDFRKPQIAAYLGLDCDRGMLSVLEGRTEIADALLEARVGNYRLGVLPTETATSHSSELMSSGAMAAVLQQIKRDYESRTVILDLPPVLSGDDVLAILPQLDCVLLVVAVGMSTKSEIEDCARHLQATEVIKIVVSKSSDPNAQDYYY